MLDGTRLCTCISLPCRIQTYRSNERWRRRRQRIPNYRVNIERYDSDQRTNNTVRNEHEGYYSVANLQRTVSLLRGVILRTYVIMVLNPWQHGSCCAVIPAGEE